MDNKEFKNLFGDTAKKNGFKKAFGGWFKESSECISVLELQKSSFGDYYLLLIKIFIQGLFQKNYIPNKELIKSSIGHITMRETEKYSDVFNFDIQIDDIHRKEKLENLFMEIIMPNVDKTLSKAGIKELAENGTIYLLPAVREELYSI